MENSCGTWVDVEDALPELDEYVLVYSGELTIPRIGARSAYHSGPHAGKVIWETDGECFEISRVTHWARIVVP